jgi:hypothetical protein
MLWAGTETVTTPVVLTEGRATAPRLLVALVSTATVGLTRTGICTRVVVPAAPAAEVLTTTSVQLEPFEKASIRKLLGTLETL